MWVKRILPAARLSQGFLYPQKHTLRYKYNQLSHRLIQQKMFSLHLWIWIKKEHVYTWAYILMCTCTRLHRNTKTAHTFACQGRKAACHRMRDRVQMCTGTEETENTCTWAHTRTRTRETKFLANMYTCVQTNILSYVRLYVIKSICTYIHKLLRTFESSFLRAYVIASESE